MADAEASAEHAAEVATAVAPQGRTGAASLHGQRLAAMHAAMAVLERTQADAGLGLTPAAWVVTRLG